MKTKILKNKIRITLWLLLFFVVVWLFYMAIRPNGKVEYTSDFLDNNPFIGKLSPDDRIEKAENSYLKITGDPVYFSLRTLRKFNQAEMTIEYRESDEVLCEKNKIMTDCIPIIEAGVLMDKTSWSYKLKPIENKIIDKASLVWEEKRDSDTILLQDSELKEEEKFNSIDEFLENLPSREKIAVYNYNLNSDFILDKENEEEEKKIIAPSLRGGYQFFIYNYDDIDIDFLFSNLNKNRDEDLVDVFLYYNNSLIDSRHLEHGENRELNFKLENLPEGLYKIEVKTNDDVISESIKSKNNNISFINKIWLAKKDKENISLYTDMKRIYVQTVNPDSLQTIKFGDQDISLDKTYSLIASDINYASSTEINLNKDGVIIAGEGVFSFSKEKIINPLFKKVSADLDIKKQGIKYIIADYNPPIKEGEWKTKKINLDISSAYRDPGEFLGPTGVYGFMISAPGLRSDDEINDYIEIKSIKIELKDPNLFNYIFNVFNSKK